MYRFLHLIWSGFPDFTYSPIKFHHNPSIRAHEDDGFLCHVVALANYLKHWIMLEPHLIDEQGLQQCQKYFGVGAQEIEEMAETLQGHLYVLK